MITDALSAFSTAQQLRGISNMQGVSVIAIPFRQSNGNANIADIHRLHHRLVYSHAVFPVYSDALRANRFARRRCCFSRIFLFAALRMTVSAITAPRCPMGRSLPTVVS